MEKYHSKSKFYSGVNLLWVIQNNESVIDIGDQNLIIQDWGHTCRFIDDLIAISYESFQKNIRNTYPAGLDLKKESQINTISSFLDLNLRYKTLDFKQKIKETVLVLI